VFKALLIEKTGDGPHTHPAELDDVGLPEGSVSVDVAYSSLNYNDARAVAGTVPARLHAHDLVLRQGEEPVAVAQRVADSDHAQHGVQVQGPQARVSALSQIPPGMRRRRPTAAPLPWRALKR
jgi:NADPH:quinone reductase-like Zn-dependent oxidoreductase